MSQGLLRLAALWLVPAIVLGAGLKPPGPTSAWCEVGEDLFCLDLIPVPAYPEMSGHVELRRIAGPFAVSPTADGRLRYEAVASVRGLPAAGSLGDYDHFVAWVAGPSLFPMVRLGPIADGETALGVVDLNQYLILVSAEKGPLPGADGRPAGPIVLRGQSPSMRLRPADFLEFALGAAPAGGGPVGIASDAPRWEGVPMPPGLSMLPALMRLRPDVEPWLPRVEDWSGSVPESRPREHLHLRDGDTLRLEATPVRHVVGERELVMYGFNGQIPGPLIEVPRDAQITVVFRNRIDWPTTIHWHGLRLDNASDGVPGLTQEPVPPGDEFVYTLRFPDSGVYWYHPHHREDVLQDLGMYGGIVARSPWSDYFGPVHSEESLMLDDLLVGASGPIPYGAEAATHQLNGRFGNVFLVNGRTGYSGNVESGHVARYYLTNVSNTRTFNLSFGGAPMKIVASDVGNFEREEWVESVVLAPAQRYVVHVRFDEPGEFPLLNRIQAIDHLNASFFAIEDTLGVVSVGDAAATPDLTDSFELLRSPDFVARGFDPYRELLERPVDRSLVLEMRPRELPLLVQRLMQVDSVWFSPVEWAGTMPMMNWMATPTNLEWVIRDRDTGLENLDIDWSFDVGDVVKIRIHNERSSLHAMQHPIHLHGQRFLVVEQDGVPNDNLVWKDTALIPVGSTVDILLDVSNPGGWMLHCHIAEHLEAGMRMVFRVAPK